jgi:hypothetical protein
MAKFEYLYLVYLNWNLSELRVSSWRIKQLPSCSQWIQWTYLVSLSHPFRQVLPDCPYESPPNPVKCHLCVMDFIMTCQNKCHPTLGSNSDTMTPPAHSHYPPVWHLPPNLEVFVLPPGLLRSRKSQKTCRTLIVRERRFGREEKTVGYPMSIDFLSSAL